MWRFLKTALCGLAIWFLTSTSLFAAIALVSGQIAGSQNAGQAGTQATTLTGTTAGHFIVVGIFWCAESSCDSGFNGGSVSTVVSSAGETCTHSAGALGTGSATDTMTDIWYCANITGGSDTITVTMSGGFTPWYVGVMLSEWSGVVTSSPDDGVSAASNSTTATTLTLTTNGNTTVSGDLIYSIGVANTGAITNGNTLLNSLSSNGLRDEYQIAGASGSYSDTWTIPSAVGIAGSVAAFKPAAGGGATVIPMILMGVGKFR